MTSVLADASSAALASAYDCVAPTSTPARASKRELLAISRTLEARALTGGAHTVLVTFQDRRHLTAKTRASYARIARQGATVHVYARGLVSDYLPDSDGLSHVALTAADPLVLEWDIVVLGAAPFAFVARDLDPSTAVVGADLDRPFSWVRTDDRRLVERAAQVLLARVPRRP